MDTPKAQELVEAAKQKLGVTTQVDLVYELRRRYGLRTAQSQVSRWESRQGPNYETTMVLLRAAGWLSLDGSDVDASAARTGELLEAAAANLEEAIALVRAALPAAPRRAAP